MRGLRLTTSRSTALVGGAWWHEAAALVGGAAWYHRTAALVGGKAEAFAHVDRVECYL